MLRDPMFYVVLVATGFVVLMLRYEAGRLMAALQDTQRVRIEGGAVALQQIRELIVGQADRVLSRVEELCTRKRSGVVLVLGAVSIGGETKQFCSGRHFTLGEGERSEFGDTPYADLLPGTIVVALGNIVLEGVFANQQSFNPWGQVNGAMPVAIIPEPVRVGAQLRVGVRGHVW